MSNFIWLAEYLAVLLFCLWLIRWGGADLLDGRPILSILFVHHWAPRWRADGLKLFAWMLLFVDTLWFIIGLFSPDARYYLL